MNELTGKIESFNIEFMTGNPIMTLRLNEKEGAINCYEKLKSAEKLTIQISKFREKRSLNANGYMWLLCGKLDKKLSKEKVRYTKEDVYRKAIKEIGIYKDFVGLSQTDAKTLRHAWELLGTGWITEQVDFMPDGENVIIRCYYGSSQYNTKQMSRLIDNIVQDCQAVGIETMTPNQIAEMISLWGSETK